MLQNRIIWMEFKLIDSYFRILWISGNLCYTGRNKKRRGFVPGKIREFWVIEQDLSRDYWFGLKKLLLYTRQSLFYFFGLLQNWDQKSFPYGSEHSLSLIIYVTRADKFSKGSTIWSTQNWNLPVNRKIEDLSRLISRCLEEFRQCNRDHREICWWR